MGLDSSAYGNYPTPFIGIFQILLKKPSYSSSNIFQIPFLRPPSQTINLRSESCLRYRCTWRREMPIFSDICVAFFGLYTNSASSTPSLRNNMRECSPLPSSQEKMPFISIRLRCSTSSSSRCNCAYLPQEQFFLILFHLIFFFLFSKAFFCSLANLRSTFFTSSAGGRFSGTIPRCTSISRTAALLAICSWLIRLSP